MFVRGAPPLSSSHVNHFVKVCALQEVTAKPPPPPRQTREKQGVRSNVRTPCCAPRAWNGKGAVDRLKSMPFFTAWGGQSGRKQDNKNRASVAYTRAHAQVTGKTLGIISQFSALSLLLLPRPTPISRSRRGLCGPWRKADTPVSASDASSSAGIRWAASSPPRVGMPILCSAAGADSTSHR